MPACTPTVEICGNGIDEDCSGADCPALSSYWNQLLRNDVMPNALLDVQSIDIAPDGSVILGGEFWGTLKPIVTDIPDDVIAFLVKFAPDGSVAWAQPAASSTMLHVNDVLRVPDGSNDILLASDIKSPILGHWPAAVYRLDGMGNSVAGWPLGLLKTSDGGSEIQSMALSPNGATLYVAGRVSGKGTFDCSTAPSYDIPVVGQYGSYRAFVAAIDMSVAKCAWAKVYEGDSEAREFAIRIGVSSAGDPVVTIPYLTNGPIGSNAPQLGPDDWGTVVAKISPFSGDFIKSTTIMGEIGKYAAVYDAIFANDTMFLGGTYEGNVLVANQGIAIEGNFEEGNQDGWAMALDTESMVVRWARSFGGPGPKWVSSFAVLDGELFIAGETPGPLAVVPGENATTFCTDGKYGCAFLSRLNQVDGISSAWYAFPIAKGDVWIPQMSWGPAGLAFGDQVEAIIDLGHGPIDAYSGTNVLAARFFPLP